MNFRKYAIAMAIGLLVYSCNNDDDGGINIAPPRDQEEQQVADDNTLQEYLKTHYFREVPNSANPDLYNTIVFDTLPNAPAGVTSIWDSGLLTTKEVVRNDVSYTLYLLGFTEPDPERPQPKLTDSIFVTYRGETLYDYLDIDGDGITNTADVDSDNDGEPEVDIIDEESVTRIDSDNDGISDAADVDTEANAGEPDSDGDGIIDDKDQLDNTNINTRVFDSAVNPIWFDLLNNIIGFREAATEFSPASGFTNNPDGTVTYTNDFGNYVVFMPSGIGYFNSPPLGSGIRQYVPLLFQVQLYQTNESDHDLDGVPSYLEDVNNDRDLRNDDSDGDNIQDIFDTDDDGDGTRTIDEDLEPDTDLMVDRDGDGDPTNDIGDGDPTNDDSDGDGIPNYLDPDDNASRTDT